MTPKQLTQTALFAVILFISSLLRIPIGPIPFTIQTFVIALIGLSLPPVQAGLSTLINLLLQCLFQSTFSSPSFGFIIGFILCAITISYWTHHCTIASRFIKIVLALFSQCLVYVIGIPYFMVMTQTFDVMVALSLTFFPFVIMDTLKTLVALSVSPYVKQLL